ncbi:MAG: shikimate kinase [Bacteroidales bacterium]|jgi:shikimate kinase|nr:shikimate kinase [Bacteroidales bacterium]
MERVVLVGFAGAGKSTLGKSLAKLMDCQFIDLDRYIEDKAGLSIGDFIFQFGEQSFRKLEYACLQDVLKIKDCVIATGGGSPCYEDAMQLIVKNSLSIYLRLSVASLFDRLIHAKKKRPLLPDNEEDLKKYIDFNLKKREPFYSRSSLIVKGENINVKQIFDQIN